MLNLPLIVAQVDPVSVADFTDAQTMSVLRWVAGIVGGPSTVAMVWLLGAFIKGAWPFHKRPESAPTAAAAASAPDAAALSPVVTQADLAAHKLEERAWVKEQLRARAQLVDERHEHLREDMRENRAGIEKARAAAEKASEIGLKILSKMPGERP